MNNGKGRWMVKTSGGLWREAVQEESIVFEDLAAVPDLERKRKKDSSRGGAGEIKKEKSDIFDDKLM